MSAKSIDLNVDLGEGFDHDMELIELASSVNIACGWHAGDALTMRRVTAEAIRKGVAIGAHPSFPDRENFGRAPMDLPADEVYAGVQYQVGALAAVVAGISGRLVHVKPHGALYNMAETDARLAFAIVRAVKDYDPELAIYGLAGGQLVRVARSEGLAAVDEAFADRAYTSDGRLVPRSQANAVLASDDAASEQVLRMVGQQHVRSVDGNYVALNAQTICLHGDGEHAVTFARRLRADLSAAGFSVARPAMESTIQ
ncbi:5-oxoprolinase subunit PxpA [Paraburkholderia fungorum]